MATEKQIAANKSNALKSTGPKTVKGKSVSKLNAVKHGLLAEEVLVLGEDEEKYELLQDQLEAELSPEGVVEEDLVERIGVLMWRLRRVYKFEAGIINRNIDDNRYENKVSPSNLGLSFVRTVHSGDPISKLSRYETSIQRSLYQTHGELERFQEKRKKIQLDEATIIDITPGE
jgi:hypothetical protein